LYTARLKGLNEPYLRPVLPTGIASGSLQIQLV